MGDNIKKPDHYCEGRKYEPKDVIRDWGLNFNLGSAVKYISRAGRKGDKLEDLQKAKQFEIEAAEKEEKSDIETEKERTTWIYVNSLLSQYIYFDSIPDEYKPVVIDKIAQNVLDSQYDIVQDIPTDELRAAVIDRIVEGINNDELDCFDISFNLYNEYRHIRDAIARQALRNKVGEKEKSDIGMTCKEAAEIGDAIAKGFREGFNEEEENSYKGYRKALDGIRKYAEDTEDTEDTVSINFEFEVDPKIDTDTVNVHVHIKNKED